ncbi:hypothetical protein [uncultured Fusobacterium sp.]|uniref:hypothetical protein n=1 Tax=uncultured Fusobacterium sp. TaxID=159267 RepID=UPI0015A519BB|nr:hypothetical protein [uncultured Fusobacterium sp.]
MNLDDVIRENKEDLKEQESLSEENIKNNSNKTETTSVKEVKKEDTEDKASEKETLKQLEEAVLKLNLKNKIEELEDKSEKLTKLLDKFASNVPIFIERLETINKGLKLNEFSNTLRIIEKNSMILSKNVNDFITFDKNLITNQSKNITELFNTAKVSIEQKGKFYKNLNKSLFYIVTLLLVINLGTIYLSNKRIIELEKRIERVNVQNDTIYKLLVKNEKFWINKEDQELYLKKLEDESKK